MTRSSIGTFTLRYEFSASKDETPIIVDVVVFFGYTLQFSRKRSSGYTIFYYTEYFVLIGDENKFKFKTRPVMMLIIIALRLTTNMDWLIFTVQAR